MAWSLLVVDELDVEATYGPFLSNAAVSGKCGAPRRRRERGSSLVFVYMSDIHIGNPSRPVPPNTSAYAKEPTSSGVIATQDAPLHDSLAMTAPFGPTMTA